MRIATVLIMIAAIATIIIAPALVGMVVGILIAFLFAIDVIPTALIGALGGSCVGLMFLLNAKENGGKGLQ